MSTERWTPLHIELMIHYHCSCAPIINADAPAVIEYTRHLLDDGLIISDEVRASGYTSTTKGEAFVSLLCRTPIPRMAFVDPEGREIKP